MNDIGKSIRTRLLNIAKKENLSFQIVIIRYLHERLLFRVSLSLYANNFCLKGGVLLYVYNREQTRPTLDIDFLGTNIPNETDSLKLAFREICSIYYPPDAVIFDTGSIVTEIIAGQDEYPGIRLFVTGNLDTIRMKDFYDVFQILTTQQLNPENLEEAIRETFRNRKTIFTPDHALFSDTFATDDNRLRQWKVFLAKNQLDQTIEFTEVINKISTSLFPIWKQLQ